MKLSTALLPLTLSLGACDPPSVDALKIESSPTAVCSSNKSLLDQLNNPDALGTWIEESIDNNENPIISLTVDLDSLDAPEELANKIPGNIAAVGLDARLHELDGTNSGTYFKAYQADESFWFIDPEDGISCDDYSFAYQVKKFPIDITITGKCELTDDGLNCQGSFYDSCPIDKDSPLGPYDDCRTLANYENVEYDESCTALD